MATLTARRTEGGQFTPDDTIEVTFDYDGTLIYCVHYLEIVSGAEVTHGGGASSSTPLHYKAIERDADGDGVIDYSTVTMKLVQTEKGTAVVKACAKLITQADWNTYNTNLTNWLTANCTPSDTVEREESEGFRHSDGKTYIANDGVSMDDRPLPPAETEYKTGDITLVYTDDDPV
jgi:hypothetical protein